MRTFGRSVKWEAKLSSYDQNVIFSVNVSTAYSIKFSHNLIKPDVRLMREQAPRAAGVCPSRHQQLPSAYVDVSRYEHLTLSLV